MKKQTIVLFCAFIILAGCNHSQVSKRRAEAEAIRNIEGQWMAATRSKDIDKFMSFFAPGAVVMNANTNSAIGLQAIRKSQESWFADPSILHETFTSTTDTIEVSASDDLSYAGGTYRVNTGNPTDPTEDTGKWVTIYKKVKGEWKAIVDIWNSDLP